MKLSAFVLAASIGILGGLYTADKKHPPITVIEQPELLALATNVVMNCPYLRKNYPANLTILTKTLEKGIYIYYDPSLDPIIYAIADPPDAIYVSPSYMAASPFTQEKILAHEMLHLAYLPRHKPLPGKMYPNFSTDPIYIAINHCYSGVSP